MEMLVHCFLTNFLHIANFFQISLVYDFTLQILQVIQISLRFFQVYVQALIEHFIFAVQL